MRVLACTNIQIVVTSSQKDELQIKRNQFGVVPGEHHGKGGLKWTRALEQIEGTISTHQAHRHLANLMREPGVSRADVVTARAKGVPATRMVAGIDFCFGRWGLIIGGWGSKDKPLQKTRWGSRLLECIFSTSPPLPGCLEVFQAGLRLVSQKGGAKALEPTLFVLPRHISWALPATRSPPPPQ